ncbi:hypothetical protein EDB83DRAFT_162954 [Lactarius deliciosus]|nr:hypothetical protein EDB83DRAFT_162954 [Lactarius deliciosus]
MSTNSSCTLPGLPTELLTRIFTHLQVEDLLSVQHTCRRFCDVISGSDSLQYFLHTEINLLEDLLPPDFSLEDRVTLLKHHETAWNNLHLNKFARLTTSSEESRARCYILQDGYLIYEVVTNTLASTAQYGYIDLYPSSAQPNAEAPWAHISLAFPRPLSDIVFAVDHNLVVAISGQYNFFDASFFEFTTGARHPLSLVDGVPLPFPPTPDIRKPKVEVFGDYLLVTTVSDSDFIESCGRNTFSVVSWKTGRATQLYPMLGGMRVVVIDPVNNLIALIKRFTNTIYICRLQFGTADPCLHSLCFLRLPGNPVVSMSGVEWIPTSKRQDRTGSQSSRGRPFPFRPYRAGTIGLTLNYRTGDGPRQYFMFVSIGALLSAAHSGVRHVPWVDWGPAGTRILPLGNGILPRTAGPFWITNYMPLVVRDYDSLRARYIKRKKKKTSELSISDPSMPSLEPQPPSTRLLGEHWIDGEVKTHLPFRKFVAGDLPLKRVVQVVADREWVVVISRTKSGKGTSITVYHVG